MNVLVYVADIVSHVSYQKFSLGTFSASLRDLYTAMNNIPTFGPGSELETIAQAEIQTVGLDIIYNPTYRNELIL